MLQVQRDRRWCGAGDQRTWTRRGVVTSGGGRRPTRSDLRRDGYDTGGRSGLGVVDGNVIGRIFIVDIRVDGRPVTAHHAAVGTLATGTGDEVVDV